MQARTVLIVEDERIVAADLRMTLCRLGYRVLATVATGAEAVAQATEHCPDLILMDIRLCGMMDGIEAVEAILARLDVPVIYLTAFADGATRERARHTAPYGYLIKPFDERMLQTAVEMALERHARDKRSRSRERLLAIMIASVSIAVIAADAHGRVLFANPAAEQLLGFPEGGLIGRPLAETVVLADAHTLAPVAPPATAAQFSRGQRLPGDALVLTARDGTSTAVYVSAAPIRPGPPQEQGVVLLIQERAAPQASGAPAAPDDDGRQIERLRVLSRGIAHDFNNLLAGVLGNAELAHFDIPADSPAHAALAQIERITQAAAALTRQLRAYAGDAPMQMERLDLAALVRETVALFAQSAPSGVGIQLDLAQRLPLVEADAAHLHQVLLNVLTNATEAIGAAGGRIAVAMDVRYLGATDLADATLSAGARPGWYVAVEVADTGCGIDHATLARIFEPFFSTKFTGRGLGLAAALGIVREHCGVIMVWGVPGAGAIFTICLPCTPDRPAPPVGAYGRQTVLVIEDDDHARASVSGLLRQVGCGPLAAVSGRSGLEVFQRHLPVIACVLLDLTVPDMSGAEVAAALRGIAARVPIIVMSGYPKDHVALALASAGGVYALPKPFRLGDLRALLRRVLQDEVCELGC